MTRRLRAWWKQIRSRVRAFWERLFGGREERRAGLSAPPPEPVVEPDLSPVEARPAQEPEPTPVVDAYYEELTGEPTLVEPAGDRLNAQPPEPIDEDEPTVIDEDLASVEVGERLEDRPELDPAVGQDPTGES
ncbi:MAG: hypothetical protein AAFQ82_15715, partial [Myxococcota bacterium]